MGLQALLCPRQPRGPLRRPPAGEKEASICPRQTENREGKKLKSSYMRPVYTNFARAFKLSLKITRRAPPPALLARIIRPRSRPV